MLTAWDSASRRLAILRLEIPSFGSRSGVGTAQVRAIASTSARSSGSRHRRVDDAGFLRTLDLARALVDLVLDHAQAVGCLARLECMPGDELADRGVLSVVVEGRDRVLRQIRGIERDLVDEPDDVLGRDRVEEVVLLPEVGVDQLLVGAGGVRDAVDPGTRDPVPRELLRRRLEDTSLCFG